MSVASKRRWLILPAVLAGVGILFLLTKNRAEPERIEYLETARVVRTIPAPMLTVQPRFLGNGNVEPSNVWNGIAQVSGKIVAIDPMFKKGAVVPEGQFLLQIDPSDYELAVRQIETNIEATRAELAQIDVQEANSNASLAIEQDSLRISNAEMERKRRLVERGTISSSDFEREQRSVLSQRQTVQGLQNTIALYPVERRRLTAELDRLAAQMAGARLDLDRTKVSAPFTGRVSEADVELYQYVRQADRLGVIDSIQQAQIEVQVPMLRVAQLLRSEGIDDIQIAQTLDLSTALGLSARVFLDRESLAAEWTGNVARFSDTLDPRTRTVGVIVEVDKPYSGVVPGVRPPLLKGLFVQVELSGRPRPDTLVIPRSALHGDSVYVVDENNRLQRRLVETTLIGSGFYGIGEGLEAQELIVVSDLVPAIEGMLLKPLDDEETLTRLRQAATGDETDG